MYPRQLAQRKVEESVPSVDRASDCNPSRLTCYCTSVRRRTISSDNETGSTLILALIFLIMVSVLVIAMTSWAVNDLNNTSRFQGASDQMYAAGGATEVAISSARYTYPSTLKGICSGTSSPIPINGFYIQDWCSTTQYVSLSVTREVTLTACLMASANTSLTGPCQTTSGPVPTLLTAVVDFDDHTVTESPGRQNCTALYPVNCGASMSIVSWNML